MCNIGPAGNAGGIGVMPSPEHWEAQARDELETRHTSTSLASLPPGPQSPVAGLVITGPVIVGPSLPMR